MNIRRLRQWTFEIWIWLVGAKIVFLCLSVIAAAIYLGIFIWRSEVSIRSAGYGLQLFGMIFAIRGLLKIRVHFGQILLRQHFIEWIKKFPKWKKGTVIGAGAANLTIVGMKAHGEVWSPDDPNETVEKRIEKILTNLERLKNGQREHAKLIDQLKSSHDEYKKKVAEQNERMREEMNTNLEKLHTSDLMTALTGLVWLTVGITMSTLAPELNQWLH